MKYVVAILALLAPIVAYFSGKFLGKKEDEDDYGERYKNAVKDMEEEVEESEKEYEDMSLDDVIDAAEHMYGNGREPE